MFLYLSELNFGEYLLKKFVLFFFPLRWFSLLRQSGQAGVYTFHRQYIHFSLPARDVQASILSVLEVLTVGVLVQAVFWSLAKGPVLAVCVVLGFYQTLCSPAQPLSLLDLLLLRSVSLCGTRLSTTLRNTLHSRVGRFICTNTFLYLKCSKTRVLQCMIFLI